MRVPTFLVDIAGNVTKQSTVDELAMVQAAQSVMIIFTR